MFCMRRNVATVTLVFLTFLPAIHDLSSQEAEVDLPSSIPGTLDFRDHDITNDGIVELNGEWLIFWNQLVDPGPAAGESLGALRERSDGSFRIPHTWNDWRYHGQAVGGHGYATFVTDLYLPRGMHRAALWIPNASTAYTLMADGQVVSHSGTPGVDSNTSIPRYVVRTADLPVTENPVRLVLQVSNFHHRRGGMWKAIKLGTPDQIGTLDIHETVYDLLLLGSFIALALFNLFLYLNQRRNSDAYGTGRVRTPVQTLGSIPFLLAVTFFSLIARVLVTGQIILTRLIPAFPWALQLRIEYVSAMVVLALFSQIASRAYPNVIPRIVIRGILVFVIVNAAVALIFPVNVYSRIVTGYNVTKSIVLLGITVVFLVHVARGRKDTWPMVGTILIFLLITLGETLHYREVILSRDFAPVGFIVALLFGDGGNTTLIYLISTLGTLVVMLVVFNWFAVRVSLAFLQVGPQRGVLHWSNLVERYGVSPRELEILQLVAQGMSNKEIGATLFISEGTVKNHLYRIMRKTGTSNRTEIVSRLAASTSNAEMRV